MPLSFVKAEPWLGGLTGKVDLQLISTPIRVGKVEAIEVPYRGERKIRATQYDFTFAFRGTHGRDLKGSGRLFVPEKRKRERMPIVVSMHYEMNASGSARFLARGCAVMTPHGPRDYTFSNLMGHGVNHSIAMARLPRRMPFVDQDRVILFGGSAGGYHALMASSFIFPVTAVYAAVPPLNLKFNINWLMRNDENNVHPDDPTKPIAPIVRIVKEVATCTAKASNPGQSWRHFSPVYRTDLITSPTLMTYVTADALVPVDQLSKDLVQRAPPGVWPESFKFGMDELVDDPSERASLLEVLDPKDYMLKTFVIPRDSPTIERKREEMTPEEASRIREGELMWSKTKRFSIFLIDEGYMDVFCGHTKYHHGLKDDAWWEHYLSSSRIGKSSLTMEKLVQLMQAFSGSEPDLGREHGDEGSWQITRRDHDHIEKWYVVDGLELYARAGRGNLAHLVRLYRKLPSDLRSLDLGNAPDARFDRNPMGVLLHQQMLALIDSGDLGAARSTMRHILAMRTDGKARQQG